MPALDPVKTSSHKSSDSAALASAQRKKTRPVRRRGRAKNITDSDDDIEREAVSSDSGEDDHQSTSDDSLSEPSEDVMSDGHTRVLTPGTSQSPVDRSLLRDELSANVVAQMNHGNNSFFKSAGNWSEMVADETANGPAGLPVVDFEDFNGRIGHEQPSSTSRTRKPSKSGHKPVAGRTASASLLKPSPSSTPDPSSTSNTATQGDPIDEDGATSSASRRAAQRSYERPPGQTARQAYQQRLESDPSYVPTLGEFWGHDDRLMDKNLRSLSGWWRVRWQERGRGRGGFSRGASNMGRGRGGNGGGQSVRPTNGDPGQSGMNGDHADVPDVPPIERTWGHDGFEEMRRREERNHSPPQGHASQPRGGGNRSASSSRARGWPSAENASSSTAPAKSHPPAGAAPSGVASPRRPWFAMRPERAWTKQHDSFLYIDPALRPRPGQGPGIRLKLPGATHAQIIRVPPGAFSPARRLAPKIVASATGSEDGEKTFVVRLPPRAVKVAEQDACAAPAVMQETVTTVEQPPIEQVSTVRPTVRASPVVFPSPPLAVKPAAPLPVPVVKPMVQKPEPSPVAAKVAHEQKATPPVHTSAPKPSTDSTTKPAEAEPSSKPPVPGPPTLAPIQTTFSPAPQPQPQTQTPYSSAYAYAHSFAHGIAMGQNGVPYDVATGRALYLQPPPALYGAQPMLHAPIPMPYAHGHVRHHMTPDFLAQAQLSSPTPPMPSFIDPSTGATIFSLPRQNSRIEIRPPPPPDGNGDVVATGKTIRRRASDSRNGAVATNAYASPQMAHSSGHPEYFATLTGTGQGMPSYHPADMQSSAELGQASQQTLDPAMAAYPAYHHQQQYFYPDAYGFPQYMDMSQMQAYDVYSSDPRASQPTAYY